MLPVECQKLLGAKFFLLDVADAVGYAKLEGKITRNPKQ